MSTSAAPPSARDVRLFGQVLPDGLPGRHLQAELFAQPGHLGSERLANLVVVTGLEPVATIERVFRRAGAAKDVHRADVPLGERRLGLVAGGRVLGQLLDPVFTVPDVELLLLEEMEEHTSELQSPCNLVCRLLLEKKN